MNFKLMPEYECHPIWDGTPSKNVSLDELSISDQLRIAVLEWNRRFQATFDRQNPIASGFATLTETAAFNEEGKNLAIRLSSELGRPVSFVPSSVNAAEQSDEPKSR